MLTIGTSTILARLIAALDLAEIAISANGDPARFAAFGGPVLGDGPFIGEGPLAGVGPLAGAAPLTAVGVTMPPWPGDDEAYEVPGAWPAEPPGPPA